MKKICMFFVLFFAFILFLFTVKNTHAQSSDNTFDCRYNPNNRLCTPDKIGARCKNGFSIDPNACIHLDKNNCGSTHSCVAGPQPTYPPLERPPIDMTGIGKISDLGSMLQRLLGYALGLAGIVFFVLLLIGGFKFITSGGDPKAVEGAKKTLTSAIIGLIVILLSYIILTIIKSITGVDVTKFDLMITP